MVSAMVGIERRRRRTRGSGVTETRSQQGPTPRDLAGLNGTFAMTSAVHDPHEVGVQPTKGPRPVDPDLEPPPWVGAADRPDPEQTRTPNLPNHEQTVKADRPTPQRFSEVDREESAAERGLRGLIGGGSSQVTVTAAMRARDAARPTPEDLAASGAELVIVRRGWTPREELPRPGHQR